MNTQTNKQKTSQVPTDNNLPHPVTTQVCPITHFSGNILLKTFHKQGAFRTEFGLHRNINLAVS